MVERSVATFPDIGSEACEKPIGRLDTLVHRRRGSRRLCMEALRQPVDLVGIENTISLHERNTTVDLFAFVVGSFAINGVGIDDKRSLLTLAHIAADFLRLPKRHPV